MAKIRQILLLSTVLGFGAALAGCATKPHTFNVKATLPELSQQYQGVEASYLARDIRPANYLVAVHRVGEPANLINNQYKLTTLIGEQLKQGWQTQGVNFVQQSPLQVMLDIQVARIDIQQDAFEYEAESALTLLVTIDNNGDKLTKQFRSSSSLQGSLSPDMPLLEEKFALQVNTLLSEILHDPQVNQYLTK